MHFVGVQLLTVAHSCSAQHCKPTVLTLVGTLGEALFSVQQCDTVMTVCHTLSGFICYVNH